MAESRTPADAERDRHHRIGLGLNGVPQPFFEGDGGVPRHCDGLLVEILCSPGRLIELTCTCRR
jgi:hypothetical protein